ncbi:MAG: hypothetical protein COB81_11210 [Flavobacteriaceae bacterium]|nr:MAG: hypothetical protein COB81_11210 [Flavobacteriaceae bacterium]
MATSIQMELTQAVAEDFKLVHSYNYLGDGRKETNYKLKVGMPFWLMNCENIIEPVPYLMSYDRDQEEIKHWLDEGRIFISKRNL